jgi:glycosyltransferase involved in cell wall biosynthesis
MAHKGSFLATEQDVRKSHARAARHHWPSHGGAERMLVRLLATMDRSRFSARVVSLTDLGALGSEIAALAVPVEALGMRRGFPDPRGLTRLGRIVREYRPDLVQSWLYHADLLACFAGARRLAWNLRCTDIEFSRYGRSTRWAVRALARLSGQPDAVLCNAEAGRRLHESLGYRPRRWEIVPNGFDLQRFRPDPTARARLRAMLGIAEDAVVIGLVARLDPQKDHATAFAALELVPEAHLVCIGGDVPAPGPRVHAIGQRSDVDALVPGFDIATLSSAYGEGFPNVLGEAMACGVPCVATDVGDAGAIIGDTGFVVPRRDPAALAAGWQRMIELGPEGRARLGAAARERVAANWSIASIARRYEDIYASLA